MSTELLKFNNKRKTYFYSIVGTINLIWSSVPISIIASLCFGYVWKHFLQLPSLASDASQYQNAVDILSLAIIVEICVEPFFILGQVGLYIRFTSFADFIHLGLRTFLMVFAVTYMPEK